MREITGGELVLECFKAEGVEMTFGITDGSHGPIICLTPDYGIRHINVHHEEAGVHTAEGYSRLTHKAGIFFAGPGPAGANMIAGLSSAMAEGHPVLGIATTRRTLVNNPDRGGAWQATNMVDMAVPVTKYAAHVPRLDRIPEMLRTAFRTMMTGRPGPAFLSIPEEFLMAKIDADTVDIFPSSTYRISNIGAGDPDMIEEAAELLVNAKKIVMHAGKGVLWADASDEFVALGNHLAAAMSTTIGAKGVIPEDHPHCFMGFDVGASTAVRNEADVILVVGSRLGEYDSFGLQPVWGDPKKQKTIHIDSDPMSIGINRPVDLPIVANAKGALAGILKRVKAKSDARDALPDLDKYRALTAETINDAIEFLAPVEKGVHPAEMVMKAREFFSDDTIIALDGGNTVLWSVGFCQIKKPNTFLYSVKQGYLGTGLGFATGAKLGSPDSPVCLITGDGAFGFNIMEMETALREKAPIVVIVLVDSAWGMEKVAFEQRGFTRDQYINIDLHPDVRYDKIAEGMACHGEYVDHIDNLIPALERATASGKPAVIHVAVDPKANEKTPGQKAFNYARTN
ncbi:MAG: thiamine pyrophosphate-binding protein [Desulfobacula sp.]|uniref:thiamine pyrophosphate-binding protein n=1 Tax=Desulfobacula sp. TaxID=2593537 RepID=UPI0025C4CE63|nr:thiamine pyrophosphate-binding protein [Desulfobacula sp.]MCD4719183.1 thiamine pyrophosphate-binding protein [Desulfobacula sp.]